MTPRISHLLETSLYVEALEVSRAFYEGVFGLGCVFADGRMVALEVPGNAVLLLFRRGGSDRPGTTPGGTIPAHDASGVQHLSFAMPWAEIAAWEAHLATLGVAVESRVVWPRGGVSLYLRDPDGHSVEVASPGLWPNW